MEYLSEYLDSYYYADSTEAKQLAYEDFVNFFWNGCKPFKFYKTKRGNRCKFPEPNYTSFDFLRGCINLLYGKYCSKDVWISHKKFDYDYKHFKHVVNYYFDKILTNYVPKDEYEKTHPVTEIYMGTGYDVEEEPMICSYIMRSLNGYFKTRLKKYISGRYIECKCGRMVLKKSNRQSMCDDCRRKKRREDVKLNVRRYREKCNQLEN